MTYNGIELYKSRGRYGVLVSPGFGAGWSTWGWEELAYDKRVIEFWLEHKDDEHFMGTVDIDGCFREKSRAYEEAAEFFKKTYGEVPYMGGFYQIELMFVKPGVGWKIEECDGSEKLVTVEDEDFIVFPEEGEIK